MKLELIEQRWSEKDKKQYIKLYNDLIKERSKGKKKKECDEKIQQKVTEIKSKMTEICPVFYGAVLTRGKNETYIMDFQDTKIDLKNFIPMINERHKSVRSKRKEYKTKRIVDRNVLGFRYKMLGGVFTESKSVLKMVGTQNDDEVLNRTKAPMKYSQDNYVGVEIECLMKCSRDYLSDCIIDANLHRYVNIKGDSSIQSEQDHPQTVEITLCAPERQIKQVIIDLCALLRRRRIDAKANNSCGLHVHLDMRNRDKIIAYNNLFKAQDLLVSMVPHTRRSEHDTQAQRYCKKNVHPTFLGQSAMESDRYYIINTASVKKYGTIEIRLHSGTTNAEKINNWIELLLNILEAKNMETISTIDSLSKYTSISTSLLAYVTKRVLKFKSKITSTAEDEKVAV